MSIAGRLTSALRTWTRWFAFLFVIALIAISCSKPGSTFSPEQVKRLGEPFPEASQLLFGGELEIKGYDHGVIVKARNGEEALILLKEDNPRLPPYGAIGEVYAKQGGAEVFGEAIEGEFSIFEDKYRLHIFTHSVMACRGGTETALFKYCFKD